ncbi:hypothetical protein FRB95_007513 [Tulasnella sp. JGI-2019a]|nr:hypothetical protein FRB95_007513 [Tulasnella sp. JGI-2019a]
MWLQRGEGRGTLRSRLRHHDGSGRVVAADLSPTSSGVVLWLEWLVSRCIKVRRMGIDLSSSAVRWVTFRYLYVPIEVAASAVGRGANSSPSGDVSWLANSKDVPVVSGGG